MRICTKCGQRWSADVANQCPGCGSLGESRCYAGEPITVGHYLSDAQLDELRSTLDAECCAKCRFWCTYEPPNWRKVSTEKAFVSYQGDCKRHAPRVVGESETGVDGPIWPETCYNDWCGDFEMVQNVDRDSPGRISPKWPGPLCVHTGPFPSSES